MATSEQEVALMALQGHLKGWGWSRDRYLGCLSALELLGSVSRLSASPSFDWASGSDQGSLLYNYGADSKFRGIVEAARLGYGNALISFCHKNRGTAWYRMAAAALKEAGDVGALQKLAGRGNSDEKRAVQAVLKVTT